MDGDAAAPLSWGVSSMGCASSVPFWGRRGMRRCRAESEVLVCWGLAQDARGRRCQGDPRLIIQPLAGQVTARGEGGGRVSVLSPLPGEAVRGGDVAAVLG